jgi:hypothetical protein
VDACPTFHLTRKSSGKLEIFDDCADEMVVSDYMHIYHKVLQREPAAEPDSQVKEVVRAMAMSQMEVQTAWRQHKESRGPDNIDVCLVEDDSSIISLVRILLKAEGLNLLSVESCEDSSSFAVSGSRHAGSEWVGDSPHCPRMVQLPPHTDCRPDG